MNLYFHFQILKDNNVLVSSEDKKGFRGFTKKLTAQTIALEEMSKCLGASETHIYGVIYSDLPSDHSAILLMADMKMANEGEYDENDYTKLQNMKT